MMDQPTSHITENFITNLPGLLPGVFFCFDTTKEHTLTYVSRNCHNLTSYTSDELKENGLLFIIEYEDRPMVTEKKLECIQKRTRCTIDYRIITKDGRVKWVREVLSPVIDQTDEVLRFEGYLSELTEKYQFSTFAKTFHALQTAVNRSSVVTITNKRGTITYANDLFCESMGYSLKELIGQDHRIVNSGIHSSLFFKGLWETILKGEVWRGEICNRSKNNNYIWFDTIITPLLDKNNEVVQFLSIRNNITDKKTFEKAVEKSEEHLSRIIESVNDIIFTLSVEGKILTLNQALENITGWKTSEWEGRPFGEMMHPNDSEFSMASLLSVAEQQQAAFFETRIMTKTGNYIYVEITSSVLLENKKVVGILGIARDITFRIQSELKLKQIHESISVKTGMNYFSTLTKYCCDQFKVKYACIGLYNEETKAIQMLSFREFNANYTDHIVKINNTPYEKVIDHEAFVFTKNLKDRFPDDPFLSKNKIESFLGYPLKNEDEKIMGIIALMDTKPISDISMEENFLGYVLSRTSNEISRYITEKKLQDSEAFNKGVLSSLNSHIAVIEGSGKIISVNEAWSNFALENGVTVLNRSAPGDNYFDACQAAIKNGDEVAKMALDGIRSVLSKKEKLFQLVYSCPTLNTERWFIMTVNLFEGERSKVVIRHLDITERRRFEKLIEKSEQNYRQLVENSKEFIFSIDANSKFTFTNNYMQKILNLKSEELAELSIFDIVQIENRSDCMHHFKEVMGGKKESNIELVFTTNRKKKIYVEGNSTPIIRDSQIVGVQSFFRDVTSRKKVEMDLIKSERRYKNVVENINDAIVVRNLIGDIVFANHQFYDLFGKTENDLDSINAGDHIAPGWQAEVYKIYSNFLKEENAQHIYVYQGIHNNGSLIWLEDSINILTEDDRKIGTQTITRDITEVKRKESELKKLITELTNRNNEMMQFNYIVSHNLRAPIANIIGLSNIIDDAKITDTERQQIIKHIRSSSHKIDDIIKDLSLVLNTRTNLNAKKETINFRSIVRGILETLEDQVTRSKCKLNIQIDPKANEIFSIKSYMESMLYNLISNAIKYRSNERELIVNLKIVKLQDHISITVSDNGIGINLKENGDYMFGLYKRFNYEVEGKGLGLHMTKTQVESLNGKISVLSEVGKGSSFIIELPDTKFINKYV